MKKILVVHNRYQLLGGEDVAVDSEIKFLSKHFEIKKVIFENKLENIFLDTFFLVTGFNLKSKKILNKAINEFNPDLIYLHNSWFKASLSIFKIIEKSKIPTIIKLHNFRYYCTKSFLSRNHLNGEEFCKACGYQGKKYRVINKYFKDSLLKSLLVLIYGKRYFSKLKSNKFKLLVLTEFHKKFLKNKLNINSKVYIHPNLITLDSFIDDNKNNTISYAGRISEEKGVDDLVESFIKADLKDTKLQIIGDGPLAKNLKNKFMNNKNIIFHDFIENSNVISLLKGSKAVVTATKLYEGQPTLLCEASLLGVPAIFPKTGGIEEFFPLDYPLSFEQFNYDNLVSIFQNIDSMDSLKDIGSQNKEFISNLLNEQRLLKNFKELIND
jgi:glycosyltransferase involved in cell wall biosynthesis